MNKSIFHNFTILTKGDDLASLMNTAIDHEMVFDHKDFINLTLVAKLA